MSFTYKNITYPSVEVDNDQEETITVSVDELSTALLPDGAKYADKEAEYIDEQISHYVPARVINHPPAAITKYIRDNIDEEF